MRLFFLEPAAPCGAQHCLQQWQQLCQPDDVTLLMGYSILALQNQHIALQRSLYCLNAEASLLPKLYQHAVQVIDYAACVQLIAQAQQHITLR